MKSVNPPYSDSYAKSGNIKKTESWKMVSERMLPNDLLAKVNVGLLKHKAWQARSSGLDKAYKAKHIYINGVAVFEGKDTRTHKQIAEEVATRIVGLLGSGRRKDKGGGK